MVVPKIEMDTILNGIRDFILMISPDQEILVVNDAFLKHMNYSREDVIGRKCYEVFQQVTRKSSNCHIKCPPDEVIRNQRQCQTELTRVGPDGKIRYTELTIFPVWEKKGKISKFIEISRDITQRKKDEEGIQAQLADLVAQRSQELKETNERLLHKDKMASLGKLASSVVHEINNPVAGILNLTLLSKRILEEDGLKEEEVALFQQYLDLMETETRRISRIVSNLLVFSHQSKIEVIKFDLNELIDQILILNSNLLKINRVRIIEDLEHNLPLISGSEDQIKQVCMNLISNAVESMSASPERHLTIKTFTKSEEKAVGFVVEDTGAGIPRETIPKIFEPFFTTKKKGKGVGLGLSVVYGIIKDHGGSLYVDSDPGKGTRFSMTLYQDIDSKKKDASSLTTPDLKS